MYPPLCGGELEVQPYPSPHRAALSLKLPRQERKDSGVSAAVWGETRNPIYTVPRRGVPLRQTAQLGMERLGCLRRCVGRSWKFNQSRPPQRASLSPKQPGQDRRDSGVSAAVAPLSPKRPRQDQRDWGVSVAVLGGAGNSIVLSPPHGASLCPKRRRDSAVSAAECGGAENPSVHGTPTGRPYPPNGPGSTRRTRVYLPLHGEKLEVQWYTEPPRGVPIPRAAKAGAGRLGCLRRSVGRSSRSNRTQHTHGASLSPKWPTQDRGDSGVSAAVWERSWEFQHTTPTPRGVPIP